MAEDQSDWKSSAVVLALMGAGLGLSHCSQPEYRRNGYASAAECMKDYSPQQCQASKGYDANGYYTGHHGSYFGPWYQRGATASDGNPGPGRTALNGVSQAASPSMSTTQRGGFGGTGRSSGYRGG